MKEKGILVHGVDIDKDYVDRCQLSIEKDNLQSQISVTHESIYDHKCIDENRLYDVIYFSGSFMLMPDPIQCLIHIRNLMKVDGNEAIYFTQTFQEKSLWFVDIIKPLLCWFTTIDFGHTTYERDFIKVLKAGGLEIVDMRTISKGVLGSTSSRLVTVKIATSS